MVVHSIEINPGLGIFLRVEYLPCISIWIILPHFILHGIEASRIHFIDGKKLFLTEPFAPLQPHLLCYLLGSPSGLVHLISQKGRTFRKKCRAGESSSNLALFSFTFVGSALKKIR
jgi:hypothetical protein